MWKNPVRFNPEVESRMKRAQKRRILEGLKRRRNEEKRERGGEDGQECREHVVS